MNIQIINLMEYPHWDELILTNDQTTFFHTSDWAKVLCQSHHYKPRYFTVIENGKLSALIPVMEINAFLTGKRAVSLPFTDECHPIAQTMDQFQSLLKNLISCGKQAGWKHIEFRGQNQFLSGSSAYTHHFTHTLALTKDEKEIFSSFKGNGYRTFSFGRTEPENQGLLQFKRGWGTREKTISYYKYDLAEDGFVSANNTFKSSYSLFKIMPLPILKATGRLIYRHVG
jgi:hypothetical protein